MLLGTITMHEQEEHNHNFQFYGVPMVCTPSFMEAFGEEFMRVAFAAQLMIAEKYPARNWDYLQTFTYGGIDFWIISDAIQGVETTEPHITFLLPADY